MSVPVLLRRGDWRDVHLVNNTSALSWRDSLLPAWWGRLPRDDGQDVVLNIGRCTAAVPLHTTNMVIGLL